MKIKIWLGALTLFLVAAGLLAAPKSKDFREVDGLTAPIYKERAGDAWKDHGRLVGRLFHPPEKFQLLIWKFKDPVSMEPYRVEEFSGAISVYETKWLPDGTYRAVIKAEGFHDYEFKEFVIKKGHDCIMDIKFGTHIFYIF